MSDAMPAIDLAVERNDAGDIVNVGLRFGPHFVVEVQQDGGTASFQLVYTHHGFLADASEPAGELEQIIEDVRRLRPETAVD